MARITVKLRVKESDGSKVPLKRFFVEHLTFGVPSGLYITDDEGRVRDNNGDLGISVLMGTECDIRILLQNSVAKYQGLEWKDLHIKNGDTRTLQTNTNSIVVKFRVMNRMVEVYDKVFRQFEVFSVNERDAWPLGSAGSLNTKKNRNQRIEVDFPTQFPMATTSFVEPKSILTGYPVIHLEQSSHIASELAHGLHFSYLTTAKRQLVQDNYLAYLITQFVTGGNTTHNLGIQTTPMVAFVEALDHFSSRFFTYAQNHPNDTGATLRNGFMLSELNSGKFCNYSGSLNGGTVSSPVFMGSSDEGAVYAAIFLDFGRRAGVGLKKAVNAYFRSKALTFGQFKTWIHNNTPELANAIDAAAANFGL